MSLPGSLSAAVYKEIPIHPDRAATAAMQWVSAGDSAAAG
jgi:hypothetical protein